MAGEEEFVDLVCFGAIDHQGGVVGLVGVAS